MKIQFLFKWYDLWIGFFYDKKKNWIYFLPLPMIGIIIKLPLKQVKKLNIPDVIKNEVSVCKHKNKAKSKYHSYKDWCPDCEQFIR